MPVKPTYPGPPRSWPQIQVLRRIWRAGAALRALHDGHFASIGLPIVEFDLLAALGNTDGMRMKDLAYAMITTPSNVTRVAVVMEEKGLLVRERSPQSDREVIARLTPAGDKLFKELFPKTVNYGAAVVDATMTPAEMQTLAKLLEKLLDGLTRQTEQNKPHSGQ